MGIQELKTLHERCVQKQFSGRYLNYEMIQTFLDNFNSFLFSDSSSFENRPIHTFKFGQGSTKVLIWTQMHGNETTGTKAILDLMHILADQHELKNLKSKLSIYILPMLNPDGAMNFTRINAQGIDMNRDVLKRESPEINYLIDSLERIKPDYCFNLHDQRNIFNPKGFKNPATLSFLAPSENPERSVTERRLKTMRVVADIFKGLKDELKDSIGRYTDEFYPSATGDNFQKWGFPTVLFEAGHYRNDLEREVVRAYNFYAILLGLHSVINSQTDEEQILEIYNSIPENDAKFFDHIEKDPKSRLDIGYMYQFEIIDNQAIPYLKKERIGDLSNHWSLSQDL
jgi:hypothetical protein